MLNYTLYIYYSSKICCEIIEVKYSVKLYKHSVCVDNNLEIWIHCYKENPLAVLLWFWFPLLESDVSPRLGAGYARVGRGFVTSPLPLLSFSREASVCYLGQAKP